MKKRVGVSLKTLVVFLAGKGLENKIFDTQKGNVHGVREL